MTGAARDRSPDSMLGLALAGYEFVSRRCARYGSDVFETRLLAERTVCMLTGEIDYDVPDQDLRVSLHRMPTLPASRFVVADVRRTP